MARSEHAYQQAKKAAEEAKKANGGREDAVLEAKVKRERALLETDYEDRGIKFPARLQY